MKKSNKQVPQTTKLFDHIRELRTRFFACSIILVIFGVISYFLFEPILSILRAPLNAPLYYSNPSGSFGFITKICLMGALTITIPAIVYNVIMFIRPAFEESMPLKRVYLTTVFSVLMAAAGVVFAYYCILPGTLHFFGGFQVNGLSALISADSYLNFIISIMITFIITFQIPLLITFIDSAKPISPNKMLKAEKWVILGSLIVAALVPFAFDFMTCLFIALPIVVLYNLSIVLVAAQHARVARKERVKVRSITVTPEFSQEFMEDPSFSFDEIIAELTSEGYTFDMPVSVSRQNVLDIQRIHHRPATVQPPEWRLNRPQLTTALGRQVNIISDIRQMPQTNHVLA